MNLATTSASDLKAILLSAIKWGDRKTVEAVKVEAKRRTEAHVVAGTATPALVALGAKL